MRVYIVGKKQLAIMLSAFFLSALTVGIMGAKTATMVSANSNRLLPIYSVKTEKNAVALGINCAWGDEDMPIILDTLKKANVKTTFFIVGDWAEKYPHWVKTIYDNGHEIGTHSHTHPDMSKISRDKIIEELSLSAKAVEDITGVKPTLFRPPSGAYNNLLIETATEQGYHTIQWNRDSLDWQGKSSEEIVERCTAKLTNGDIILLHSGTKNTANALPRLIEKISKKGYSINTVGDLIYKENFALDHEGRQYQK